MSEFKTKLIAAKERCIPPFLNFLDGPIYPIIVGLLAVVGHTFTIEFYCNFFVMIPAIVYLLFSKRIRGFLPALLMIMYQITPEHSPIEPGYSDYYFTGHVFVILVILVSLLAASFIFFFIRNIAPKFSLKSPLLFPLILLSLAFLLGGAFSGRWVFKNLFYSVMQIFGYFMLFFSFYYGIENEDPKEFIKYITNLAVVISFVICAELMALFITDGVFTELDEFTKTKVKIHLGWGMWNPIGFSLTVLIPLIFRGALFGEKYRPFYLAAAIITWVFALLSLSRNAQLFSTIGVAACVIIGSFRGRMKITSRILLGLGSLGAVALCILMWDKIPGMLSEFFYDNGRFQLWGTALENFASSPIFGKGFYGFGQGNNIAAFLPWLAHNTPLEFMSAMGILGIGAYIYYRVMTVMPFLGKYNDDKLMLALPILLTLGMSFIDNYVFHVYTMFIYTICLATVYRIKDIEISGKN